MKRNVGIAELKAHLSDYIRTAQKGREIVIRDRNTPVARLVPAANAPFRTIPAKGSLKGLDKLPGVHVDLGITPEYLDQILSELRMDYYDKWIASKQST